jgi:hypothetical protein
MRTTLTIEPDVALRIKRAMARKKIPLKRVVNDALRAGLAVVDKDKPVEFSVEPHPCKFKPGVDLDRLNQLVDEMDAEASLKGLSR